MTIPANDYRMSGEAPAPERGHVFDLGSMIRPTATLPRSIDPDYLAEAVATFAERGMHGPLNDYRALDRYFALASAPYAGAR